MSKVFFARRMYGVMAIARRHPALFLRLARGAA